MSFVRVGCRNLPPKKKRSRKREWDDTVNDLDAYKATPEEIEYRKAAHRSKHAVSTHLVLPGSAKKGKKSSPFRHNSLARKIALMKEVLYDQKQLQEVLEKSDTMMAVVKDLFGDDPRRFEGFPAVTTAPNCRKADVASSLVNLPPEMKTKSEELSDTLMTASALNDFHDSDSDLEDSRQAPLSYQPKMNMQRFQLFLEAEERNNTLSTISGQASMSHLGCLNGAVQSSHLPDQTNNTYKDGTLRTPPKAPRKDPNESLEILQPPKSAMNDTNKIHKTRQRVPRPEPALNTSNLSLNELRKVLETLEDEIADYEQATGRRPPAERNRQETFSGYTLALVDSVTKLTRYLRECELQLKVEVMVREQLTQDVVQFRALVDALTSDIILTQEEFQKMLLEFQKFRIQTQEEIRQLKGGQPSGVENADQSVTSDHSTSGDHVHTETPPRNTRFLPHKLVMQSTDSLPGCNYPRAANPFGDHLQHVSAAVMLSPPVRRSRVTEPDREIGAKQQQGNLLEMQDLATEEDFSTLPSTCPSSLAPALSQYMAPPSQSAAARQPVNSYQAPAVARQQPGNQSRAPTVAPVNSVSVPRPTPLVQSNVGIPMPPNEGRNPSHQNAMSVHQYNLQQLSQNGQPISIVPQDKPQTFNRDSHDALSSSDRSQQSVKSHDSQGSGPDRDVLASQIAALNKQHAEAQRRLQTLMYQQQAAQGASIAQQQDEQQRAQQQQQQQQQYQQQQRQQVVENQQRIQQQQLQFQQQQKLIEMVIQQQQKIQQQQLEKQQEQMLRQQQQTGLVQPNIPGDADVRQSADFPGYRPQKQTGLPSFPISPNISPISQRSESVRPMYQAMDSRNGMAPSGRGITVSIPSVDMDQSNGSPSPNPPIGAR